MRTNPKHMKITFTSKIVYTHFDSTKTYFAGSKITKLKSQQESEGFD